MNKVKSSSRLIDLTDESKESFFSRLFDKYNLSEEDLDASMTRVSDFEPHASYNELMDFLQNMPDRYVALKTKNATSLTEQQKINRGKDKLEPIKDVLMHIIKEDYEENKKNSDFKMTGKHQGQVVESSVKQRNLNRMRNHNLQAERKHQETKHVLEMINMTEQERQ